MAKSVKVLYCDSESKIWRTLPLSLPHKYKDLQEALNELCTIQGSLSKGDQSKWIYHVVGTQYLLFTIHPPPVTSNAVLKASFDYLKLDKGPGILCMAEDTLEFKDGENVLNINKFVCLLDITMERSELETLVLVDFTERLRQLEEEQAL
jgi:hypothetical protein